GAAYPELRQAAEHVLRTTRTEEERFLETIGQGMERMDELAPPLPPAEIEKIRAGEVRAPVLPGADVFRLYDTFGFPLDLTELIARERGYAVDEAGFEAALEEQRERSRQDRLASGVALSADALSDGWEELDAAAEQVFVGYEATEVDTDIVAYRRENGRVALQLRQNPFYAEAGGQVSDRGTVEGDGWRVVVDDVRRVAGRVAVLGDVDGDFPGGNAPIPVRAQVLQPTRHDTERNHTATHLLHAALRKVLGTHVVQRGSLVAPDRLRFDFSHTRPMTAAEIRQVEDEVNRAILADTDVCIDYMGYQEALGRGAMALFGEKYGDVVRTITVPGVSMELCGGTHVRHTAEIGLFRIVSETGVAAGVRRIEAVTGPEAYRRAVEHEQMLREAAAALKTTPENLERRIAQLSEENRELKRQLDQARAASAQDAVARLVDGAVSVDGARVVAVEVEVASVDELRAMADGLRARLGTGAAVVAGKHSGGTALIAVVTDDLISRGVRADRLVREVATATGGSGGGRPHMAQGGVGDASKVAEAIGRAPEIVRRLLSGGA
ncbi:MAG TPA: alanine--tRNA ligase-related protein, partial [Longimicrobiales bacterium]|nr:alanine--tRNA ligase-related protein [Longimicrobiales bacterium]